MIHQEKYLKHKEKYCRLKNMFGGNYCTDETTTIMMPGLIIESLQLKQNGLLIEKEIITGVKCPIHKDDSHIYRLIKPHCLKNLKCNNCNMSKTIGGFDEYPQAMTGNHFWRCKDCDINICGECLSHLRNTKIYTLSYLDSRNESHRSIIKAKIETYNKGIQHIVKNYLYQNDKLIEAEHHAKRVYLNAVYEASISDNSKIDPLIKLVASIIFYERIEEIQKGVVLKLKQFIMPPEVPSKCSLCSTKDNINKYKFDNYDIIICEKCVAKELNFISGAITLLKNIATEGRIINWNIQNEPSDVELQEKIKHIKMFDDVGLVSVDDGASAVAHVASGFVCYKCGGSKPKYRFNDYNVNLCMECVEENMRKIGVVKIIIKILKDKNKDIPVEVKPDYIDTTKEETEYITCDKCHYSEPNPRYSFPIDDNSVDICIICINDFVGIPTIKKYKKDVDYERYTYNVIQP
jgi:hypothetical protein